MKAFLAIFIILLFCTNAFAQKNFHLLYDYNLNSDFGNAIIQSDDKGYVVFGDKNSGSLKMGFLKTDSMGIVEFHKTSAILNDEINGGGIWKNGYYAFGDHSNIVEGAGDSHFIFINQNGDSVKVITINFAFNDRIHDAILLADSSFVVMGFYTDTLAIDQKPFAANVDSAGNINWFKTYGDSNINETIVNMEATLDGGYIIGGKEEESATNSHTDLFLLKIDSVGNKEWKMKYHEPLSQHIGHVTACKDGGFALVGTGLTTQSVQRRIIKTDSAGNFLWDKKYGSNLYDEGYIAAREMPNGDFALVGASYRTVGTQDIPDVNLTRLDSAGNLIWSKDYTFYGGTVHDYAKDLIVTSDGGLAVTGFITNTPHPQLNDLFILKTDGNGLITGLNSGFVEVEPAWKVYPNPTRGQLTIPAAEGLKGIELYDVQGKLLQVIARKQSRQSNLPESFNFDINAPKGIYLLRLIMDDGTVSSTKIVKE